jgi:hypothetical protein
VRAGGETSKAFASENFGLGLGSAASTLPTARAKHARARPGTRIPGRRIPGRRATVSCLTGDLL